MIGTKVITIAVLRDLVAVAATALQPIAVLGLPVRCAAPLPDAPLFGLLPVLLLLTLRLLLLFLLLILLTLSLLLRRLLLLPFGATATAVECR